MGRFTVCWSLLVLCLLVGPVRAGVEEPDHRPAGAGDGHQGDAHLSVALPDSPPLLQSTTVPPAPSSLLGPAARWVERLRAGDLGLLGFMRRVYLRQMERAAERRSAFPLLSGNQLARIEGDQRARPEVARAARALLAAARADLERERRAGDPAARRVARIGVLSAYRPPSRQFGNWLANFSKYFRQTAAARLSLAGGSTGPEAVDLLARFIEKRLAAPGYSFHNGGTAIDFTSLEGGLELTALTDAPHLGAWRRSWLFHWLSRNAARFHFYPNTSIDEPWHWEHRTDAPRLAETAPTRQAHGGAGAEHHLLLDLEQIVPGP